MTVSKTKHSTQVQVKVKVALEAIKRNKTTAELTSEHGVHATQINNWKKAALDIIPEAFSSKRKRADDEQQALVGNMHEITPTTILTHRVHL